MGRASRLSPGKQFGHILVPISEEGSDASEYETAVSVIRAYAEQDEEFREGEALPAVCVGWPLGYAASPTIATHCPPVSACYRSPWHASARPFWLARSPSCQDWS